MKEGEKTIKLHDHSDSASYATAISGETSIMITSRLQYDSFWEKPYFISYEQID